MHILEIEVDVLESLLFLHVLTDTRVAHWGLDVYRGRLSLMPGTICDSSHGVLEGVVWGWRPTIALAIWQILVA